MLDALNDGDVVDSVSSDVQEAQVVAMDRILHNHELYCTVCDYNNGGCEIHNTVKEMKVEHHQASLLNRNLTKRIIQMRFTAMIRISVSSAGAV